MIFNFDIFTNLTKTVYHRAKTTYSLDEVLSVFSYFFRAYKKHTGQDHPPIKLTNIIRLIEAMDDAGKDDEGNTVELRSNDYPPIIDRYFATRFGDRCNYRINHFFSGQIRLFRYYEWLYGIYG